MGTIIAAGLNIVLNIIFIPKYGFIAAAYTTLFCYFVLMFVHLFITRIVLRVNLYDDWFMFAAIGAVVLLAALFMSLYSTMLIRYTILATLCILYLILNRKPIKGAIRIMKGNKA